jgi:hypothetical protein
MAPEKFHGTAVGPVALIPAHAGIQVFSSNSLDSGSRFLAKAGITPACPE